MKHLLICLFICIFVLVKGQSNCNLQGDTYYTIPGWVKVQKDVKAFKWISMWGVSDHSPREFAMATSKFRYHCIETKRPQQRYIHNCLRGTMNVYCGSNDDTGNDILKVEAGGKTLFQKSFGEETRFTIPFRFSEPTTIIITVYSIGTPNNSPGAFLVRMFVNYHRTIYVWKKAVIEYHLN